MPYKSKERQRAYQAAWKKKRRYDYLADKSCCLCGSRDRMEVDHIDPALKTSHDIWSWTEKRRNAELAKCQVLCYTCHHAKHNQRKEHSLNRYREGCRCEICVRLMKADTIRRHPHLKRS